MTTITDIHPDYITGTWRLDPAHSEISFTVRHLMISKVRGKFDTFDVTVTTPSNPAEISVNASIDIGSVSTGNEMRDNHLRTSDFFQVDAHPMATFQSTSVRGSAESFTLEGELTLRGVTLPVAVECEFGGVARLSPERTVAAATGRTTINRLDFGVNWNAALEAGGMTLGDEVTINFDLELVLDA